MPTMSIYCKAYPASRLRDFPQWSEKVPPLTVTAAETASVASGEDAPDAAEPVTEEYYYVHDNYVVTAGVFVDADVAFDAVTEDWKRCCASGTRPRRSRPTASRWRSTLPVH